MQSETIDKIFIWLFLIMAFSFAYSRLFMVVTELDKIYYSMGALLWLLFGITAIILRNQSRNQKEIIKLLKEKKYDRTITKGRRNIE